MPWVALPRTPAALYEAPLRRRWSRREDPQQGGAGGRRRLSLHRSPRRDGDAFEQDRGGGGRHGKPAVRRFQDRKSTRLNSSHGYISYAVFCLKKKKKQEISTGSNKAYIDCGVNDELPPNDHISRMGYDGSIAYGAT